ncbi:hypothetical protein [Aquimonas voraii]|uniref:Uncharacterized protein n=1 Tax=Aquimonas voraii TaxID=265719 RepID=A0A1G6U954_9GAMM|nr:hypothetical protein [Aquimonas voraii]SDD37898.1 hypothetical protein SAMN04488509_102228 [Aquimonas voraii]
MLPKTVILLGLCLPLIAWAQASGGSYVLPRDVNASGGGQASGGSYQLQGSIGQPAAEPLHPASGGPYALSAGFWAAGAPDSDLLYADGFESP